MPCPLCKWHILCQFAMPVNEYMRRNLEINYLIKIGVIINIEIIGKQLIHIGTAKFTRWQADPMDYHQVYDTVFRSVVTIGRYHFPDICYPG